MGQTLQGVSSVREEARRARSCRRRAETYRAIALRLSDLTSQRLLMEQADALDHHATAIEARRTSRRRPPL
jgi:hypothetical protein